jgi:Flp pilus assembly pilin Flp
MVGILIAFIALVVIGGTGLFIAFIYGAYRGLKSAPPAKVEAKE